MMLTFALVAAAISIGAVHTLAPDHWVPFAALARAERWSAGRTALVTAACGLGHVTVSVALGLLALFFGYELLHTFGERLESVAGLLLIGFGVSYAVWGLHGRIAGHGHSHLFLKRGATPPRTTRSTFDEAQVDPEPAEGSHRGARAYPEQDVTDCSAIRGCDDGDHPALTAWTLFLLFSADPCVAVIPLLFAAAPLGWVSTVTVVAAYELATITTMVMLVLPARAAAAVIRGVWFDQWGDALAGAVVATVGLAVMIIGI
jgi:nickel/cobalt transporter (NicO) family protein